LPRSRTPLVVAECSLSRLFCGKKPALSSTRRSIGNERQRVGPGVEFAERVQAVFDGISAMPELHAIVHRDVRKALVRRFPYAVFYRVRAGRVVVLAVFHAKRDPELWKSRI